MMAALLTAAEAVRLAKEVASHFGLPVDKQDDAVGDALCRLVMQSDGSMSVDFASGTTGANTINLRNGAAASGQLEFASNGTSTASNIGVLLGMVFAS